MKLKCSRVLIITLPIIAILISLFIINNSTPTLISKKLRDQIPGHFYTNIDYEYDFIKDYEINHKIKEYKRFTTVSDIEFGKDNSPDKKCTRDIENNIVCANTKIVDFDEIDHVNRLMSYLWSPDSNFIISKWVVNHDVFPRNIFRLFAEPDKCIFYITNLKLKKTFLLSANEFNCPANIGMFWYI